MKRAHTRASVLDLMRAYGYDAERAAKGEGVTVSTIYQRMRRVGVTAFDLEQMRRGDAPTQAGDVRLTETGVALSLADYAILQTRAAEGYEVPGLRAALESAERIISTLTRNLDAANRFIAAATGQEAA